MIDAVCVGDVTVDLITQPIPSYPEPDTQLVTGIDLFSGGESTNTAAALSSLGIRTALVGAVGKDALGDWILRELKKYKLQLEIKQLGKQKTSITMASCFETGKRSFITDRGANQNFNVSSLPRSKIVLIGGYWHCHVMRKKGFERILKQSRKHNTITCLNIGWDESAFRNESSRLMQTLNLVDYFMLNDSEAKSLTNTKSLEDAIKVLRGTGTTICLHLGSKGSRIVSDDFDLFVPAFKVKPLNTTGAGDAWNAGFIHQLLRGKSLSDCALFGNACAAVHITREKSSYPRVSQVMKLMKSKKP